MTLTQTLSMCQHTYCLCYEVYSAMLIISPASLRLDSGCQQTEPGACAVRPWASRSEPPITSTVTPTTIESDDHGLLMTWAPCPFPRPTACRHEYHSWRCDHWRQVESARPWVNKLPQAHWTGRIRLPRDAGRQAFQQCLSATRSRDPQRAEQINFNNLKRLTMTVRATSDYLSTHIF